MFAMSLDTPGTHFGGSALSTAQLQAMAQAAHAQAHEAMDEVDIPPPPLDPASLHAAASLPEERKFSPRDDKRQTGFFPGARLGRNTLRGSGVLSAMIPNAAGALARQASGFGSHRTTPSVLGPPTPGSPLAAAVESVSSGTPPGGAPGAVPAAPGSPTSRPSVAPMMPPNQSLSGDGSTLSDGPIKHATKEALIERLTTEKLADATFMNHFLLTHNAHTPPLRLLELLIQRYNSVPPTEPAQSGEDVLNPTRLRVFVVLRSWVERLWNSSTSPEQVALLEHFCTEAARAQPAMRGPAEGLLKLVKRKVSGEDAKRDRVFGKQPPVALVPLSVAMGAEPGSVSLKALNVREFARQLCLIELDLFQAVRPWELVENAFNKKDKSLAPNVFALTQHFNKISRWASLCILSEKDVRERAALTSKLIELAEECSQLNNFNAVNEIIAALQSASVHRLARTWRRVSARRKQALEDLRALTSNVKSYALLRQRLHTIHPPCIPYLGLYLTDLTFIEEGNPTMVDNLVNFNKCRLLAAVIMEIQTYQQTPYCLEPVQWIQDFVAALNQTADDNMLWNMSLEIEPRKKKPEGEEAQAAEGESDDEAEPQEFAGQDLTTMQVLPLGMSSPVALALPPTHTVANAKEIILQRWPPPRWTVRGSVAAPLPGQDSCTLIATAAVTFPTGLEMNVLQTLSELPTFNPNGDLYALFAAPQVVTVCLLAETETVSAQMMVDAHSPLFCAVPIIENVFDLNEEFSFAHAIEGSLRWLNANTSLSDQDFDQRGQLIVVPLSRIHRMITATEGTMNGVLLKYEMRVTGLGAKADNMARRSPTAALMTAAKRRFFVAVDNFLLQAHEAKDISAVAKNHIIPLDFNYASYTLRSGVLAISVKSVPVFRCSRYEKPRAPLVVSAQNESQTRAWFNVLKQKSLFIDKTRVFGVDLRENVLRADSTSLVPFVLRHCLSWLYLHGLSDPELFSDVATGVDRLKDLFDAGAVPTAADMDRDRDTRLVANLCRVFLAELPDSLIFGAFFPQVADYAEKHKTAAAADADGLKHFLARLPPPNSATLYFVLTFARYWAECSGVGLLRAAQVFGPLIIRNPLSATAAASGLTGDDIEPVCVRATEDLLACLPKLGLVWKDAEVFPTYSQMGRVALAESQRQNMALYTPITILSFQDQKRIASTLSSARPLHGDGCISPRPQRIDDSAVRVAAQVAMLPANPAAAAVAQAAAMAEATGTASAQVKLEQINKLRASTRAEIHKQTIPQKPLPPAPTRAPPAPPGVMGRDDAPDSPSIGPPPMASLPPMIPAAPTAPAPQAPVGNAPSSPTTAPPPPPPPPAVLSHRPPPRRSHPSKSQSGLPPSLARKVQQAAGMSVPPMSSRTDDDIPRQSASSLSQQPSWRNRSVAVDAPPPPGVLSTSPVNAAQVLEEALEEEVKIMPMSERLAMLQGAASASTSSSPKLHQERAPSSVGAQSKPQSSTPGVDQFVSRWEAVASAPNAQVERSASARFAPPGAAQHSSPAKAGAVQQPPPFRKPGTPVGAQHSHIEAPKKPERGPPGSERR